jgi:hypothetical protein
MKKTARNAPCPCGSGKKFKRCCMHRSTVHRGQRPQWQWITMLGLIIVGIISLGGTLVAGSHSYEERHRGIPERQVNSHDNVASGEGVIATVETPSPFPSQILLSAEEISHYDLLALNLLCAQGLPGIEPLNIGKYRNIVKSWAARVKHETDKYFYQFRQDPNNFSNSEAYFRMLMLVTVLQQDFGVRYNPQLMAMLDGEAQQASQFFCNANNIFLHGILDARLGTCASMPALTVVVGRELGYPLKLVPAKGHLFVRWERADETFNIESASRGMHTYPDTYYETWPTPLSQSEKHSGYFLASLSPVEEYVTFLELRGSCLLDNEKPLEALAVYEHIRSLMPEHPYIHQCIEAARYQAQQQQHPFTQRRAT